MSEGMDFLQADEGSLGVFKFARDCPKPDTAFGERYASGV
jgi:hypothetical protein